MCLIGGAEKRDSWLKDIHVSFYCVRPKDDKFSFRGLAAGDGGVNPAQLCVSSVRNAASFQLSVAWLKSFNPFGVESPDGASTSLHLLTLSL